MLIENIVSTIESKTRMDLELKADGQGHGHKISIFKNEKKKNTGISS